MGAKEFHPVQVTELSRRSALPSEVTLRAYEVYCALWGEQPAMVDLAGRNCRGGFEAIELIALLYARSFPREEWRARFNEAIERQDTP